MGTESGAKTTLDGGAGAEKCTRPGEGAIATDTSKGAITAGAAACAGGRAGVEGAACAPPPAR